MFTSRGVNRAQTSAAMGHFLAASDKNFQAVT